MMSLKFSMLRGGTILGGPILVGIFIFGVTLSPSVKGAEGGSSSKKASKLNLEATGIIVFEQTLVDFGLVNRGQKLSATFQFKNVGKGPLVIQGVQASCDCTTSEVVKGKSFAPGETGTLDVAFNTTDYAGKVTKTLTVVTNDRSMPDRTLTITALVNSEIEAKPPLVDFGEVVLNQTPERILQIKNNMKTPLKIETVDYNKDALEVVLNKDGSDYAVRVKLKSTTPIGFFKDTIWIKNNSSSLPDMPIPVRATIKGQIAFAPAYVEFGVVPTTEKISRQLSLTGTDSFEITGHTVALSINGTKAEDIPNIMKVTISPRTTTGTGTLNQGQMLLLELSNPGSKSGSIHGTLSLQTTNSQQKIVPVDFYAFFK